MAGSITLPQIVLDLEEEDRLRYEVLRPPASIVVRYGSMRLIAELAYDGEAKPGCGSKLVVRTNRGIELGEMLTTTCGNGGCGKNITRKQMLEYIDNSGGRDYPFSVQGKVLRIATPEDLAEQSRLDSQKTAMIKLCKSVIAELDLAMKLVDVELLLGGERIIFHYASESWIDFRELVRRLAAEYQTRIEMHQVNARDEARLVADYEKCGQHCCCKQFLKVLKPVSMRSAKVQKATLDPTKISGRCGRLMCCLRYEDETYESLRKKLPNRQSRVMTADGPGTVLDTQILTQLALVRLDNAEAPVAFPIENIQVLAKTDPNFRPPAPPPPREGPAGRTGPPRGSDRRPHSPDRTPPRPMPGAPLRNEEVEAREGPPLAPESLGPRAAETGHAGDFTPDAHGQAPPFADGGEDAADHEQDQDEPPGMPGADGNQVTPGPENNQGAPGAPGAPGEGGRRRRRRRRRRGRGGGGGGQGQQGGGPPPAPQS